MLQSLVTVGHVVWHFPCNSLQMLQPPDCGQVWWKEQESCGQMSGLCAQPLTRLQCLPLISPLVLEDHILSGKWTQGVLGFQGGGEWPLGVRLSSTSFGAQYCLLLRRDVTYSCDLKEAVG